MTATLQTRFRGLNTDISPSRLASGTATVATNVTVRGGKLQKRGGFGVFEDDVNGSAGAVKNLAVAHFADGDVYVVAKVGTALLQRKTNAASFSAITGGQTHNASDRGWFFMWADRLHYFDRVGGTRWNPDANSGTAFKAGLCKPSTAPAPTTAGGGEKDGSYHVHWCLRNSTTHEEGILSGTHTPAVECAVDQDTDISGIAISNWATLKALHTDYEWDQAHFYTTLGNTEHISRGGDGEECFSYVVFDDAIVGTGSGTAGLNKADHVRDKDAFGNAGGEPPGAAIGCYTGNRAVYGKVYNSTPSLIPGRIMFSLPEYPTMVPQEETYSIGGDSKTFVPRPWEGVYRAGVEGGMTAMAYGGGIVALFGSTQAWALTATPDQRLYPVLQHASKGAVGDGAVVGTPFGVFAIGYRSLLLMSRQGVVDLAENRFETTMAEIPAAYQSIASMGYYGWRNQVWAAVAQSGETLAQRILVWDLSAADEGDPGALTIFEPAGLDADEGITCMCELAYDGASPTMLVGTSKGRILQYPTGSADVNTSSQSVNYAATWKGWFGQERVGHDQKVEALDIHCGANVASNVTLSLGAYRSGTETVTAGTYTLGKSSHREEVGIGNLDYTTGNLFSVQFASTDSVSEQWSIDDLSLRIERDE